MAGISVNISWENSPERTGCVISDIKVILSDQDDPVKRECEQRIAEFIRKGICDAVSDANDRFGRDPKEFVAVSDAIAAGRS